MNFLSTFRAKLRDEYINKASMFRRPSCCVHILNAHFASSAALPDKNIFTQFLDYLQEIGEVIDFDDAVNHVISGNVIVSRPTFALSFDDGFIDCYDTIFPELHSRNIKAGFFINSNLIDGAGKLFEEACSRIDTRGKSFMNWKMIEEMSRAGQIYGSHGASHIRLIDATDDLFKNDIILNHSRMFDNTGFYPEYFAWPFGRNTDISIDQIKFLLNLYKYIMGGDSYKYYTSYSGSVINRRHIEPFWDRKHINYFVSHEKKFFNIN